MKGFKIIFLILISALIYCSSEKDKIDVVIQNSLVSFYNNRIHDFRANLEELSMHYLDSVILFDTIAFDHTYKIDVVGSKKINKTLFTVKTSVGIVETNSFDTLNIKVIKDSSYQLQLEPEDFQRLLFYEDSICMNIGRMLYSVEKDEEALQWFQFKEHKKNAEALYYIGKIYSLDKKYDEALEYLYSALKIGYDYAIREVNFIHSIRGEKSKATEILTRSAKEGNIEAMEELGANYEMYDPDSAFYWFMIAAKNGSFYGMTKTADVYERGIGRPVNLDSAFYWHNYAAELGDAFSQIELARFYLYGIGTEQDFNKGWSLLEDAKEARPIDAYYLMGQVYQEGIGVIGNKKKAFEYYKKAQEHGSLAAKWRIKELGGAF